MSGPWDDFQAQAVAPPTPVPLDAPPPAPPAEAAAAPAQSGPWQDFAQPAAQAPIAPPIMVATGTGVRGIINAETGKPYNDAQEATYADLNKRGVIDANAPAGSAKLPKVQTDPLDLPKPGEWYVDVGGKLQQRPPDPWLNTAGRAALEAGAVMNPSLALAASNSPEDPRLEAAKSGLMSGLLFGGKNEVMSTLGAVPAFVTGGMDKALPAFRTDLTKRDRADDQLRQDFPIVHDASAVAGAVLPSVALPEAAGLGAGARLALNSGQGALGGYLSTNGSLEDRGKGAALGAAGGAILGEVLPRVLGALPRTVTPSARGAAETALGEFGLSSGALSPEAQATLDGLLKRGADPAQAARTVAASSLPTPVPLALGQVTGLPGDQLALNMAARGARGQVPAARAQAFTKGQQDALRSNVSDIASSIAGGEPPLHGQGAVGVSNDLTGLYDAKAAKVDAAYDAARANPAPAILPQYDAQAMHGAVASSLSDFDPLNVPRVAREVDRLGALSAGDVNLKDLFAARSRLSQLRASVDPVEAKAAGQAVGQMDRSINDAITGDLFHGDPASVQQWKTAIGERADMGQVFDQGDLVDRLTQRTGTGGQRRLVVDPGYAANYILGRSDLGFVGRQNLYTDLTKVKSLVTPEAWNALRSEVFQRIANAGEGAIENGSQQFSGAKFQKAWNTAQRRDSRLIDAIFSPAEQQQINQFAGVASRVTSPVRGGDNPSNTSVAGKLLRLGGNGVLHLMDSLPLIKDVSGSVEHITNNILTTRALKGQPVKTLSPLLPLLPGRAGGYIGARIAEPQADQ